jgi:hypothetical protein
MDAEGFEPVELRGKQRYAERRVQHRYRQQDRRENDDGKDDEDPLPHASMPHREGERNHAVAAAHDQNNVDMYK